MEHIKPTIFKGVLWIGIENFLRQGLRIASNVILAYFLYPKAFGIMALVSTIFQGLEMISDAGISRNIIQSHRGDDPNYKNTAWTFQIIRCSGLFLVAIALAKPIAIFYDEPMLAYIVPACAIGLVIKGFQSIELFTHQRKFEIERLAKLNLISQFISTTFLIVLCYFYRSVWCLVINFSISVLIHTTLSHLVLNKTLPKFRLNKGEVSEIIEFGRWIVISSAITFFARNIDGLIIGKCLDLTIFGLFNLSLTLIGIAFSLRENVVSRLVYPLLSHYARVGFKVYYEKMYAIREKIILISLCLVITIFFLAEPLIGIVYPRAYHPAGTMVKYLILFMWFESLKTSLGAGLMALGKTRAVAINSFVQLFSKSILLLLGFYLNGIHGMLVGMGIASMISYFTLLYFMKQNRNKLFIQDIKYSSILLLIFGIYSSLTYLLAPVYTYEISLTIKSSIVLVVMIWTVVEVLFVIWEDIVVIWNNKMEKKKV